VQKGNIVEYAETWSMETTTTVEPYSWYVYTTHSDGGFDSIGVSGCESTEEACLKAEEMAWRSGWTNPKWWQYWRWGDRDVYLVEPKIKYSPSIY
jgi:hypothetical protein